VTSPETSAYLARIGIPYPGGDPNLILQNANGWDSLARSLEAKADRLAFLSQSIHEGWMGDAADAAQNRTLAILSDVKDRSKAASMMARTQDAQAHRQSVASKALTEIAVQVAVTLAFLALASLFPGLLAIIQARLALLAVQAGRVLSFFVDGLSAVIRGLAEVRAMIQAVTRLTRVIAGLDVPIGRIAYEGVRDFVVDLVANVSSAKVSGRHLSMEQLFVSAGVSGGIGALIPGVEFLGLPRGVDAAGDIRRVTLSERAHDLVNGIGRTSDAVDNAAAKTVKFTSEAGEDAVSVAGRSSEDAVSVAGRSSEDAVSVAGRSSEDAVSVAGRSSEDAAESTKSLSREASSERPPTSARATVASSDATRESLRSSLSSTGRDAAEATAGRAARDTADEAAGHSSRQLFDDLNEARARAITEGVAGTNSEGVRLADRLNLAEARYFETAAGHRLAEEAQRQADGLFQQARMALDVRQGQLLSAESHLLRAEHNLNLARAMGSDTTLTGAQREVSAAREYLDGAVREHEIARAAHQDAMGALRQSNRAENLARSELDETGRALNFARSRNDAWKQLVTANQAVRDGTAVPEQINHFLRDNRWHNGYPTGFETVLRNGHEVLKPDGWAKSWVGKTLNADIDPKGWTLKAWNNPKGWRDFVFYDGVKDMTKGTMAEVVKSFYNYAEGRISLTDVGVNAGLGAVFSGLRGISKGFSQNRFLPHDSLEDIVWRAGVKSLDNQFRYQSQQQIRRDLGEIPAYQPRLPAGGLQTAAPVALADPLNPADPVAPVDPVAPTPALH
jgi:hypothetical protein